ncbi:hypothetical protein Aperf_G00000129841 [Anoplocephala perfoliata]
MESHSENQANTTASPRVRGTTTTKVKNPCFSVSTVLIAVIIAILGSIQVTIRSGLLGLYIYTAVLFFGLLIISCICLCQHFVCKTAATHNDEREVEEGPNNTGSENAGNNGDNEDTRRYLEDRRRRQRTPSPPMDFRLPDEMPKLPDYDKACESEGIPPDYDTLSIAPPEYEPPFVIKKGENRL